MTNDDIIIETDEMDRASKTTEEISVAGRDLSAALGRLAREATVRKVTVKNADGKMLFEIPFLLGTAGVLLLGPWTAALLGAAWLTRLSILIEYEEAPATMKEALLEMPGVSEEMLAGEDDLATA